MTKYLYFDKNDEISIKELKKSIIPYQKIVLMDKKRCVLQLTNKKAFKFLQHLKKMNVQDKFSFLDALDFAPKLSISTRKI